MTLQTTGAISLNDLHIEAGGTSGTQVSLNDADIIKLSNPHNPWPAGSERRMSQFYGQRTLLNNPFVLIMQVSGQEDAWRQFQCNYGSLTESSFPAPSGFQPTPWKEPIFQYNLNELVGRTGRLLFIYQNGGTGTSYEGDIQIDNITINGIQGDTAATNYSWESSSESWQTVAKTSSTPSSQDVWALYDDFTWSTVSGSLANYRFVRDAGGTGSANTGRTDASDGSYYMYAETSGSSTLNSYYFLRSPELTFGSGTPETNSAHDGGGTGQIEIFFNVARLGSNIGTLRLYFVESGHGTAYSRVSNNTKTMTPSARSVSKGIVTLNFPYTQTNMTDIWGIMFEDVSNAQVLKDYPNTIQVKLDPADLTSPINSIGFTYQNATRTATYTMASGEVRLRPFDYIRIYLNNKELLEFIPSGWKNDIGYAAQLYSRAVINQDNYDSTITTASSYAFEIGYT